MNFIVLVKQVPDVANIPEDAWDREKGTLRRGVLDSVLNPLDLHALTFACRMRKEMHELNSSVVCLTMGPPQAREVLTDSLSRGADEAVLLTDRAFGGADTVATAYSLARAIHKIQTEIFKNSRYIIVSGMQSVDGDTAQVPAQVAEDLGIEHIAYAQAFRMDNGPVIQRIGPAGMETVAPLAYPFLITVTACTQPLYRSLHRSRTARQKKVIEWNARAVEALPQRVGLTGSRTQVFRIFSPSEEKHKECKLFTDAGQLVAGLRERFLRGPAQASQETEAAYRLDGKQPTYQGEVWVYVEQEEGTIKQVSFELIAEARKLAGGLNEKVGAVLLGHQVEGLARELIAQGADKVYLADHPLLKHFLPIPYKKAVGELVKQHRPQIMLFGATPLGRELAPRVAYSTDSGLTADCTKLDIDDFERGAVKLTAILKQTRPALGGNIMATIMTKDSKTQMATVRPGVFKAGKADPARAGEVVRHETALTDADIKTRIVSMEPVPPRSGVADADIVVSGGRGLGTKAKYDKFIRPLAKALAGVLPGSVEVGASRMAVEDGFIGHDHQVGQTGQTVQPRLYVALGISGAVQHISGMQNSEIVVVINKDPRARIFNYADFGMVGDVEVIVPQIIEALSQGHSVEPRVNAD
jgi:electron transfer flavoprotein alpha subunit